MAPGAQAQAKATPQAGIMVSAQGVEEATGTAMAIAGAPHGLIVTGDPKRVTCYGWPLVHKPQQKQHQKQASSCQHEGTRTAP